MKYNILTIFFWTDQVEVTIEQIGMAYSVFIASFFFKKKH